MQSQPLNWETIHSNLRGLCEAGRPGKRSPEGWRFQLVRPRWYRVAVLSAGLAAVVAQAPQARAQTNPAAPASPATGAQAAVQAPSGDTISIVVLKEHGVGSAALAQPYLDRFVASVAAKNKWPSAIGQYVTNRAAATAIIDSQHSHYAILSLGAFLGLREKYHYDVVGQVAVTLAGGRRYFLISKTAGDLDGCRGKTLASDHTDDPPFIEKVVFAGKMKLSDFQLVQTQRPLQTITKVVGGHAVCGLIDDAQLNELPHLEGAKDLQTVWKSNELPPMPVVAFPNASKTERAHFQESLPELCHNGGESACAEVGIVDLKATGEADYKAVIGAYAR